jgi:hypothetical protein
MDPCGPPRARGGAKAPDDQLPKPSWSHADRGYGGYATGNVPEYPSTQQWPIARDRQDMVFQANMLMKF